MGDWREQAACRNEDFELFFPIGEGRASERQIKKAKAICHTCPVYEQCLTEALNGREYGIWAATTETERARLKRKQRRRELKETAA